MKRLVMQWWYELSERDRIVVAGLSILVLVSLSYVVLDSLQARLARLDRQIAAKQRDVAEIQMLGRKYQANKVQRDALEQRIDRGGQHVSLLSVLEEAASTVGLRSRIVAMNPRVSSSHQRYKETGVEVRLEAVPFPEVLRMLEYLEKMPSLLQFKRVQLTSKADMSHLIDVALSVATYERDE